MNKQLEHRVFFDSRAAVFSLWAGHQPGKHIGFLSVRQKSMAYAGLLRLKKRTNTKMGEIAFVRLKLFCVRK